AAERPRAFAGAGNAVKIEPARGERHFDAQLVAPGRLDFAGDQLRPAILLEGQRQIFELGATRIGLERGLKLEGRLTALGPELSFGLGAPRGGRLGPERAAQQPLNRQPRAELPLDARPAHKVNEAPLERIGRSAHRGAYLRLEPYRAVGVGRGR